MKQTESPTKYIEDVWLTRVTVIHQTNEREPWWPYKSLVQYYVIHYDKKDGEFSYNKKHSLDSNGSTPYAREWAVRDLGEDVVAKAERIAARLPADWDRLVRKGQRSWQHKMLVEFAKKIGWPTHYRWDLETMDAARIADGNPQEWLGIIRECGTWIVLPTDEPDPERRENLIWNSSGGRFYYANKDGVKEITPAQFQSWEFKSVTA